MSPRDRLAAYAADPAAEARDKAELTTIYRIHDDGAVEARLISKYTCLISTQEMLLALFPTLQPIPEHPSNSQVFYVGQPVELRAKAPEYPVARDPLIGAPLWVMCVSWREDGLDYMVTTSWPPADFADRRCKAAELIARDPSPAAKGGAK